MDGSYTIKVGLIGPLLGSRDFLQSHKPTVGTLVSSSPRSGPQPPQQTESAQEIPQGLRSSCSFRLWVNNTSDVFPMMVSLLGTVRQRLGQTPHWYQCMVSGTAFSPPIKQEDGTFLYALGRVVG